MSDDAALKPYEQIDAMVEGDPLLLRDYAWTVTRRCLQFEQQIADFLENFPPMPHPLSDQAQPIWALGYADAQDKLRAALKTADLLPSSVGVGHGN